MKKQICLIALSLGISSMAQAKIVQQKNQFFVKTRMGSTPIHMLNDMIAKKQVSKVRLYDKGNLHAVSFSKNDGPVKLYSVDVKGYIYSISPFSDYNITAVDDEGKFQFREVPNKKYVVNDKGFFLY